MNQESVHINLNGDALQVLTALRSDFDKLLGKVDVFEKETKDTFNGLKKGATDAQQSLRVLTMDVLGRSVDLLGAPFRNGADAVYDYDTALTELSAITDITGPELENLGDMARAMALEFGGTPQDHLDSYTKLLSALTPAIAESAPALDSFGRTVAMLANTMGGDATGAVRGLESAMNQYGVSLADPIEASRQAADMANVMAAAAKAGKLEVPGLADAMTRSGAEAAQAGVKFDEFAASLELGMLKFGSSERLGTAMRGVFQTIGSGAVLPKDTQAQLAAAGVNMGIVNDQSLTLKQRLTELGKIQGDAALMEKVFGAGETTAGRQLLQNLEQLDFYINEIRQAPDALEQMNDRIMGSYSKSKERLDNIFAEIRLSVFENLGGALPYFDLFGGALGSAIQMAPGLMALHQGISMIAGSTRVLGIAQGIASLATWGWTAATGALSAAWAANPIGIAIAGIAALTAGVVYAWDTFDGFRGTFVGLWEVVKTVFGNIFDFWKRMFSPVLEAIGYAMDGDWSAAAKAAGMAAFNMVTLPGQAIGATLGGELTEGMGDAWSKGYERGVAMKDKEPASAPIIMDPLAAMGGAGAEQAPMVPSSDPDKFSKSQAGGGGSSSGGGGRIITVNIESLIKENINQFGGSIENMAARIREEVQRALIGAVRDFEVTI